MVKVVIQGKLFAVAYTLRTYCNSSLWAEFVNKNRCISVRLVSEEVKIILIIPIIVSYDQNISMIFYMKDWSHVRLLHPSCVYITTQRLQYKRCVHLRNNFPCIITLIVVNQAGTRVLQYDFENMFIVYLRSFGKYKFPFRWFSTGIVWTEVDILYLSI